MALRILVTGASGFIGSALMPALADAGHRVRAAARRPIVTAGPVEFAALPDLTGPIDWSALVAGMDVVVHLAGIAHRGTSGGPQYDAAIRQASASLARACVDHGVKRLVYISSIGAQTGSAADHVVTEVDEPRPVTDYDIAKLAAEKEVRQSGAPYTILRPVIVYGPKAKANLALLARIAALPIPLPFAWFDNRRSLVALDNVLSAIAFCLEEPATLNQTFIVADAEPVTIAEILSLARAAQGRTPQLMPIPPALFRIGLQALGQRMLWDRLGRDLVASSAKLQAAGWRPTIDIRDGLRAAFATTT